MGAQTFYVPPIFYFYLPVSSQNAWHDTNFILLEEHPISQVKFTQ